MKALVTYRSRKGTTRQLGKNISNFLEKNNIDVNFKNILDVKSEDIHNADILLIGCWTNGMFLLFQHPDSTWRKMVRSFPKFNGKKIGLFTTYKILTGTMFKAMNKILRKKTSDEISVKIKSKNESLSEENQKALMILLT